MNWELESFMRLIFKDSFTEAPKKKSQKSAIYPLNDYGWSHVAWANPNNQKEILNNTSYRTFSSFFYYIKDQFAVYFTPNTFSSRHKRDSRRLRWLNDIFIDIDDTNLSLTDIYDKLEESGLPSPTLINQTPRGGYHLHWVFCDRVPATPKAKFLYNLIVTSIVKVMGADPNAVGAERLIRLPRNIVHFEAAHTYKLSDFKEWYDINIYDREECNNNIVFAGKKDGILRSKAVRLLLKGVDEDNRNNACYCLAQVFKHEGYTFDETLDVLVTWNENNNPPLPFKELVKTVRSAYRKDLPIPVRKIETITGEDFSYAHYFVKHKKDRKDRTRNHLDEWINDIVEFLRGREYSIWEGSQRELAEMLNAPLRSIKEALKLIKEGKCKSNIEFKTEGKGKYARTILILHQAEVIELETILTYAKYGQAYLGQDALNLMVHTANTLNYRRGRVAPFSSSFSLLSVRGSP